MRLRCKKALVVFTSKESVELFGGNEGKQILSSITKQGQGSREYLVGGNWILAPEGKVEGLRYILPKYTLSKLDDIASIWKYIKDNSIQPPTQTDKILEQLMSSKLKQEKLMIFSPWGPRYNKNTPNIEENDLEVRTLKEIRTIFEQFNLMGYNLNFLLMPADVYGTEVNSLSKNFIGEYFKRLGDFIYKILGEKSNVMIKLWSEIREENQDRYLELSNKINGDFFDWIKLGEYKRAINVAGVFSPNRIEESAKKYCIERLVEGNIIDEIYKPIKLSLVKKEKDYLDGPLKRIYIIKNKAPWLGGN